MSDPFYSIGIQSDGLTPRRRKRDNCSCDCRDCRIDGAIKRINARHADLLAIYSDAKAGTIDLGKLWQDDQQDHGILAQAAREAAQEHEAHYE